MSNGPLNQSDPANVGGLPAIGSIVAGRYRVERVVGAGGMGFVYAARHVQLNELVAIKVLHPKVAVDEQSVERFLREARACVKIRNEHGVKVIDVFTGEGGTPPYILMEFLTGEDLGRVVATQGPLPIHVAVDYILQACEAIAEAHTYGIVHRDIKPANLLLTQRSDGMPFVKVLDFGISKALVPDEEAKNHNLTETTAVFGSPTYMSPEQVRSAKHVDERADVWSLGIVLFELLTGTVPFGGASMSGLLASIVADPPRPLRSARPDAPEALEAVILACLEKNRDRRMPSVPELAQCLRPYASPMGGLSVDVICRIASAKISPSLRPPMVSLSSAPVAFGAFSATERSVVTSAPSPARSKAPLIAAIAAAVLVAAGLGALATLKFRQHATGATQTAAVLPTTPPSVVVAPSAPATASPQIAAATQTAPTAPSASTNVDLAVSMPRNKSGRPRVPVTPASAEPNPPASASPNAPATSVSAPPPHPSASAPDMYYGRY